MLTFITQARRFPRAVALAGWGVLFITGCGSAPSAAIPAADTSAAKPAETSPTGSQPTLVKPLPISEYLQASPAVDDELGFLKDQTPRVARRPEEELFQPVPLAPLPTGDLLPLPSTIEFGP